MAHPGLESLFERVSSVLHCLPGAIELYLYGSAADPNLHDAYSDLDLQVVTSDYALSQAAWPWILQKAGRIKLAYPLRNEPQESAYSIAFEGESLFHKVDIGLVARDNHQGFIHQVEKKVLLWQQPPVLEAVQVTAGAAYQPVVGTPAYFLLGQLMGAVRYVKARTRGQHLTCWRFLSAQFNGLLRCYQWDGDPDNFPQAALSTWEFNRLDRLVPEAERLGLLTNLHLGSALVMDRSLIDLTQRMASRVYPEFLDDDMALACLVREYIDFLIHELS